jgi:dolichol-phosphate mannosyltransferase
MSEYSEPQAVGALAPQPPRALSRYVAHGHAFLALACVTDALAFTGAIASGAPLGPAHIFSFVVATAVNFLGHTRVALAASGRARGPNVYGRLLMVSLLALFLRGGVLGLCVDTWSWSPYGAIFAAIGATLAVTVPGYAMAMEPAAAGRLESGARWRRVIFALIAYALVLRLIFIGQVELLPEESYYWNYARHLDIGYLDHPPMVGWLIRLTTELLGTSQFGVRAATLGCACVTAFFSYRLARDLFGMPSALGAMLLSQVLPFFFVAGLIMTPDTPLIAAWAAELYFLERALVAGRAGAWWGVGVAMGFGLLCKYSIGLLALVALGFLLMDPRPRGWLRHWRPYAAALIALAIFSPVLAWNARNEWVSFLFQTSRRLAGNPEFALQKIVLAALVMLTPVGVWATAVTLWARRGNSGAASLQEQRKWRFIALAIGVPLATFVAVSLRHDVKFDWTGELWLAAVPLMARSMISGAGLSARVDRRIRAAWMATILGLLVAYAAALHFLVLGLPAVSYPAQTELLPIGWRDLGRQVSAIAAQVAAETGSEPLIVGMDRYGIASEVAFYAHSATAPHGIETSGAHLFGWTGLMYQRWVPRDLQNGRTLLLVTWKPEDLADQCVQSRAARFEPVRSGTLTRDGRIIRRFYYRVAYGYRSAPPCA